MSTATSVGYSDPLEQSVFDYCFPPPPPPSYPRNSMEASSISLTPTFQIYLGSEKVLNKSGKLKDWLHPQLPLHLQ